MVIFPYQRLAYLFDAIESETVPQDELAKRFAVTTRTIRTDIATLNNILIEYGAKIIHQRKHGYQLSIVDKQRYLSLPKTKQQIKPIPRTVKERQHALILRFLMSSYPIKLDCLADEWFISRSALQQDMQQVKAQLVRYQLTLNRMSRYGMKLTGSEIAIRTCIIDMLWQQFLTENQRAIESLIDELLANIDLQYIKKILQNSCDRFDIRLNHQSEQYLMLKCAVSIVRITTGHEIMDPQPNDVDENVKNASWQIAKGFAYFLGTPLSHAETQYLQLQIAARRIPYKALILQSEQKIDILVSDILGYINNSYNYDLRDDQKLIADLSAHLLSMITRVKYQVSTANPLLADIKKYYPFAYDVTLSAMSHVEHYFAYHISEDEIGYLAVHIGVGLERNYSAGYQRHPQVLIVSDAANSTLRMIEAKMLREYPQIQFKAVISPRDYQQLDKISEDFVITTVRLLQKNQPIVKVAAFPTPYQLEQVGRLVMIDRTKPYILERFFDESHFMIINQQLTQAELFTRVCLQLEQSGHVTSEFYRSLVEREAIVSTLLGENIALPHALGLLAKKTVVVTILAPNGIAWGNKNQMANVIFLLAISKQDYEEAMAIYDLFVTFVREKATKRLLSSKNFSDFQSIAKDSLGRSA